jgi:putative flavoprotein involved in K+ transport
MLYDTIIIGAGQAGLSMGYYLKQANKSFLILDKGNEIGDVWRNRYDSLTLFTPRSYSSLPGLSLGGNEKTYPTKDEIADYLSTYVDTFALPVQHNTNIQEVSSIQNGFRILTNNGEFTTRNVVIATGPFQTPLIPDFAKKLSQDVYQVHSSQYRNPSQLEKGPVLVVGGGNSGSQIAVEVSEERETYISVSHKAKFLPQDIGNRSIFWYFDKLGIYRANVHSKVGQFLRKQPDPIFGFELKSKFKSGKISSKPRTISIEKDTFFFEDGSNLQVKNVIWSTGFKSNYDWIHISGVINEKGLPIHQRGVTPIQGLYFLGLPWQSTRGSALIQGVGADAKYLHQQMMKKS